MDISVSSSTKVTLNFSLSLEDGSVVDTNIGEEPVTFDVGDGSLLPGFERAMFGLQAGDEKELIIKPEEGFGMPNSNNIQAIPIGDFPDDITLEKGLMLSFADAKSTEMPGVVKEIQDGTVMVDFNHPLSGRTLLFKVIIHAVSPAVTH